MVIESINYNYYTVHQRMQSLWKWDMELVSSDLLGQI